METLEAGLRGLPRNLDVDPVLVLLSSVVLCLPKRPAEVHGGRDLAVGMEYLKGSVSLEPCPVRQKMECHHCHDWNVLDIP